jgi:hypothetical protein
MDTHVSKCKNDKIFKKVIWKRRSWCRVFSPFYILLGIGFQKLNKGVWDTTTILKTLNSGLRCGSSGRALASMRPRVQTLVLSKNCTVV